MANNKSQDVNAKNAIKHINSLNTIEDVSKYISDEADTKKRKTVLAAAAERNEFLIKNNSDETKSAKVEAVVEEVPKSNNSTKEKKDKVPFNLINSMILRGKFTKDSLTSKINEAYPESEIKVEAINAKQVAFYIDGERLPEEGHYSVD